MPDYDPTTGRERDEHWNRRAGRLVSGGLVEPIEFAEADYACAACKDLGIVEKDGYAYPCECRVKAEHVAMVNEFLASVPPRYANCGLEQESFLRSTPTHQNVIANILRNFLGCDMATLLLHGGPGTGKTHLAVGVTRMLLDEKPRSGMFLSVPAHLQTIRSTFDGDSERQVDQHPNVDVLVLDDLSAARATDWSREWVYRIISWRYDNLKKTIITSNLGIEDIGRTFGEPVASRLYQDGVMIFTGNTDRRKGDKR